MGSQRVGHGWANFTQTGYSTYISSRAHLEHGRTEDKGRYPLMLVVSSKSIVITQNDLSVSRRWWSWFSCSVTSNSLWPHGLQHARIPCPSLSPRVCPNSCPLSWWGHPTISSSASLFSSCLQSFPASRSVPVSRLFTSGGQNIGTSASILPVNLQGWFPLGLTALISLLAKDSQESSSAPQFESINSLVLSLLYGSTLTSICEYWKNHSFDYIHLHWQNDVSAF